MKAITKLKALLPVAALACSSAAWANQIVLEGSDATTFHRDAVYIGQLLTFMKGASALPVLTMGTGGALSGAPAGTVHNPTYSLAGFDLSKFSALYIESTGGCCTQADHSISAADQVLIGAAEALGLNLTIENYGGGPAWGPILPLAVNLIVPGAIGGISDYPGHAGGPTCTDREKFNANGLGRGFIQPPVLGCYEHQGYRLADFAALGFISLVDADPAYFGFSPSGAPLGSALLALGGVLGTPVPEPESIALLGLGLAALAASRKRKAA